MLLNKIIAPLCTKDLLRTRMELRGVAQLHEFADPSTVAFVYIVMKFWVPHAAEQERARAMAGDDQPRRRASGRQRGQPAFLSKEVMLEYENIRKIIEDRMRNTDNMEEHNFWWTKSMERTVRGVTENNERGGEQPQVALEDTMVLAGEEDLFRGGIRDVPAVAV